MDQSLAGEASERVADGSPTHPELVCQIVEHQPGARRQPSLDDRLEQGVVHVVVQVPKPVPYWRNDRRNEPSLLRDGHATGTPDFSTSTRLASFISLVMLLRSCAA